MAKKEGTKSKIGVWAFFIGLIISVLVAIFVSQPTAATWVPIVLGILGIIVGLLNVSDKEINLFLIATIAFLISFGALSNVFMGIFNWQPIANFFDLLALFIAPATAIVAIKAIVNVAKNR